MHYIMYPFKQYFLWWQCDKKNDMSPTNDQRHTKWYSSYAECHRQDRYRLLFAYSLEDMRKSWKYFYDINEYTFPYYKKFDWFKRYGFYIAQRRWKILYRYKYYTI